MAGQPNYHRTIKRMNSPKTSVSQWTLPSQLTGKKNLLRCWWWCHQQQWCCHWSRLVTDQDILGFRVLEVQFIMSTKVSVGNTFFYFSILKFEYAILKYVTQFWLFLGTQKSDFEYVPIPSLGNDLFASEAAVIWYVIVSVTASKDNEHNVPKVKRKICQLCDCSLLIF